MTAPTLTIGRVSVMAKLLRSAPRCGLVLEFGVASGSSITGIARELPDRMVYGFDSFAGLPEDWADSSGRLHAAKSTFAGPVPQNLPSNVELVIGLFQHTLPVFLSRHPESAAFIHIDCDLHSSTSYVLDALRARMNATVVVFDEFCGVLAYEEHEGRAWREFIADDTEFEILNQPHGRGAAFRVTTNRRGYMQG
jgi:Macrocin-O-methyltransferase (TylF)